MFHKMLVCLDGSPGALNAARTGAALARQAGCSALLLSVLDSGFLGARDGEDTLSLAGSSIEGIARSHQEAAQTGAAPLFAAEGIAPQSLSERGHPVGTIVAIAQREGCDLIVLGSHGQGGSASFLFGSVADGVLRHASCSVLIVPDAQKPAQDTAEAGTIAPNFRRLLLASDASQGARRAADVAIELAARFGAALTMVNVYEEPGLLAGTANAFAEYYPEEHEQRVIQALEQSVQAAQSAGIACTLRREKGHAAQTILRVAAEENSDVLIVGHRGEGGFEAMLLGSVSNRVAQQASCPVLVAR